MENNILGLIFSENPEVNLGELMNVRALAAVPVGGRYRIIDFILSNMVNSEIINVGITTGYRHRSLTDHLGSGKAWDLSRKENGLFILPPPEGISGSTRLAGGIDYINSAMSYLKRSRQEYVLLGDCNTICNINFKNAYEYHLKNNADITVIYTDIDELPSHELEKHILLDIAEDTRVTDIKIYPKRQRSNHSYMHFMIIEKSLLMDLIDDCLAHDKHRISNDILLANLTRLKIYGYKFEGYKKKIDSIKSFFDFNLDLLDPNIRHELFGRSDSNRIYTKIKDSVPTHYGKDAEIINSFVADGCSIEGSVENCIIFRGVKVGKGSKVKDSIIMQNSQIMDNCTVENAIFDKEIILSRGKKLIGQVTYPLVIAKRTVI